MTLDGTDFLGTADEYYAWVRTSSAGFVLDDLAMPGNGTLRATVGPVAVADTGSVELWRGHSHATAPITRRIDGRLVSARDGSIFVARLRSSHGPSFSASDSSPLTWQSSYSFPDLVVDLRPPAGPQGSIRVDVVIETGGQTEGTDPDHGNIAWRPLGGKLKSGSGPSWAYSGRIELDAPFEDTVGASAQERLAAAVAEILNQQLGDLGLVVRADGEKLSFTSVGGILGGFVTVVLGG